MVARGAHIEHFNQVLQRSFYRCLNMERGSIRSCLTQALGIVNNSFSRRLGMSPAEAVKLPLKEIQRRYNRTRYEGDMKYMKTKGWRQVARIGESSQADTECENKRQGRYVQSCKGRSF